MKRSVTMLCTLALGLTACSSSQPVCPCAEASDDYASVWASYFDAAPEPFFTFRNDTLAFALPDRPERVPPDSLLRRFRQWGWPDQDRAAWAAEMDPGVVMQPDSTVEGAMRVIPPTVPPHAIRNLAPEPPTRPPAIHIPESFGKHPSQGLRYFRQRPERKR